MESQARRYVALFIGGSALIAAACSEPVAPVRLSAASHLASLSAWVSGPGSTAIRGNDRDEDNAKPVHFELRPKGGKVRIGGFELNYPANAVCDPGTSGYGPDEWKKPCETLTESIKITGKVWVENGRTHADFSPDIRFDPSKDVYMSVKIKDIEHQIPQADWTDTYGIWYSTRIGDVRYFINDALDNPELASVFETHKDGKATGWMTRKIWHFSGYYVRSGRVTDDGDNNEQGADEQ